MRGDHHLFSFCLVGCFVVIFLTEKKEGQIMTEEKQLVRKIEWEGTQPFYEGQFLLA